DLGDVADVDLVLVGLGIAQRRRLRVDLVFVQPHVGILDDRQALGDRRHHAVLDAVVHHLDEVTGTGRPAVQVALRRGAPGRPARRLLPRTLARRDRAEYRVQARHGRVVPADHQAVPALKPPDAAAGADVKEVDAPRSQGGRPGDVVAVV